MNGTRTTVLEIIGLMPKLMKSENSFSFRDTGRDQDEKREILIADNV